MNTRIKAAVAGAFVLPRWQPQQSYLQAPLWQREMVRTHQLAVLFMARLRM